MPSIRQRKPTSMPQHVRMGLEAEPSRFPCSLNHAGKASSGERSTTFAGEQE
jgi:hypothetical protein